MNKPIEIMVVPSTTDGELNPARIVGKCTLVAGESDVEAIMAEHVGVGEWEIKWNKTLPADVSATKIIAACVEKVLAQVDEFVAVELSGKDIVVSHKKTYRFFVALCGDGDNIDDAWGKAAISMFLLSRHDQSISDVDCVDNITGQELPIKNIGGRWVDGTP